VVLVVVLWLVALLSVIAASMAFSTRTETTLAQDLRDTAQARALAEAGVSRGILELLNPDRLWRWRADGTVHALRFGGGTVQVALQDEGGKIDLNTAQRPLLDALLKAYGVEDADDRARLLDAIEDWRDPGSEMRLNGAEDADYEAAGRAYGAKDGVFNTVDELQQVLGFTPRLFKRIKPALTVHSRQPGVDVRVAPPSVLRAIWLGAEVSNDEIEAADPRSALSSRVNLSLLSTSNGVIYTVHAWSRVPPDTRAGIVATVKVTRTARRPYRVLAWKEDG
jgi:general secretion pathway protein K